MRLAVDTNCGRPHDRPRFRADAYRFHRAALSSPD
jgi:hypothetical protein